MNDLMIDLETLSTAPGAHILSLGAVWFDRATGELGPELYVVTDPGVTNGEIDADTVCFWSWQSGAARRAVFAPECETVTLGGLLRCLNHFIDCHWDRDLQTPTLWSRGYKDPEWLDEAYRRERIQPSYQFRWWADQRTVMKLTGSAHVAVPGVEHHALDDCKAQILDLVHAMSWISVAWPLQED